MKHFLSALFLFSFLNVNAQEDTVKVWTKGGISNLAVSQVALKNWVGGGQSSVALSAFQSLYLNMNREKYDWSNKLDVGFGLLKQGKDGKFFKNDDRFIFLSKLSRNLSKYWALTGIVDFRTQFAPGYTFPKDSLGIERKTLISKFMSPGYLISSLGFEFKTEKTFYIMISPITGKFTFVMDPYLSSLGMFGVEKGENMRSELGSYLNAGIQRKLMDNISLDTKVTLFSSYQDFGNIDVNWELLLVMKVNKLISTSISTQLIYDNDIDVVRENGTSGPDTQFKEVLNIGVLYQFNK